MNIRVHSHFKLLCCDAILSERSHSHRCNNRSDTHSLSVQHPSSSHTFLPVLRAIFNITMLALVSLLSLAVLVHGHGCPKFSFAKNDNSNSILRTNFLPPSFSDFIDDSPEDNENFNGVYDCHIEKGDAEVAVNAICNGTDCMCQALFQFQECHSCTLCVQEDGELNIETFSADCTSMDDSYSTCTVGCGFETDGCYPDEVPLKQNTNNNSGAGTSGPQQQRTTTLVLLLVPMLFLCFR
jgi:hypothetical protein